MFSDRKPNTGETSLFTLIYSFFFLFPLLLLDVNTTTFKLKLTSLR